MIFSPMCLRPPALGFPHRTRPGSKSLGPVLWAGLRWKPPGRELLSHVQTPDSVSLPGV